MPTVNTNRCKQIMYKDVDGTAGKDDFRDRVRERSRCFRVEILKIHRGFDF